MSNCYMLKICEHIFERYTKICMRILPKCGGCYQSQVTDKVKVKVCPGRTQSSCNHPSSTGLFFPTWIAKSHPCAVSPLVSVWNLAERPGTEQPFAEGLKTPRPAWCCCMAWGIRRRDGWPEQSCWLKHYLRRASCHLENLEIIWKGGGEKETEGTSNLVFYVTNIWRIHFNTLSITCCRWRWLCTNIYLIVQDSQTASKAKWWHVFASSLSSIAVIVQLFQCHVCFPDSQSKKFGIPILLEHTILRP